MAHPTRTLTDSERSRLHAQARAILEERVTPLESRALHDFASAKGDLEGVRELVKSEGLYAPHMPPEYGGMGLSFLEHARLTEVLGRSPIGHYAFGCQAPDAGNMEILLRFGTDEQKERFLRPLVEGRIRSCFSMTEPGRAGSNPVWLETTARREGDQYVIDGRKWFTSSADGATFAVVMAVTNPDAAPHARASQILVPLDSPGFTHVRRIPVMGEGGSDWASHSEVTYEGVRVPASNLLGKEGAGFAIAQERLGPGRIHHAMRWLGIAERALELHAKRLASRELTPGEFLGSKQVMVHALAESRVEIDAARLLVYKAADSIDREGTRGARVEISGLKFFCASMLNRVLDRAIQAHGALGMTDDTVLAWFFRHERAARIYDGPDEVHKDVVGRAVMAQLAGPQRP